MITTSPVSEVVDNNEDFEAFAVAETGSPIPSSHDPILFTPATSLVRNSGAIETSEEFTVSPEYASASALDSFLQEIDFFDKKTRGAILADARDDNDFITFASENLAETGFHVYPLQSSVTQGLKEQASNSEGNEELMEPEVCV
jgi:hypothetical protein